MEKTKNDNYIHSRLKIILNNSNRLLRLINQILDFKKIDNYTIDLSLKKKNIIAFSRKIYDAHRLVAEEKNIRYTFSSNVDSYSTWFDPDKLDKILYNLLSNAFKFTRENGEISIECSLKNEDKKSDQYNAIVYNVKDTGIGISKDHIDKIFDRFYQIDQSDTRQYEGSGIGLSLTKHLVELHDGTIHVTSKINKGTCFEVKLCIGEFLKKKYWQEAELDIDNKVLSSEEKEPKIIGYRKTKPAGEKPLLLVVEDNDELRSYIREELISEYEILDAKNGKEGFEIAIKFIPDIIVSDVMMPLVDGFTMCENIKNEWITSHIPIILLTAKVDEKSHIQGLQIGADAYINKPFQIKRLKAQIENLILNRKKLQLRFKGMNSWNTLLTKPENTKDDFLSKMCQIIEANIPNSQFGVEFLAGNLNMSRSKLYKKTYSLLSISAGELIREIRLKKAVELLKNSNESITEIALMVGFSDHPQFTRSFTNQFGISPKQYQLKNKKN
ncbi:MAG: response regulator [Bacteroidales bacterium]|nr:response regulator [Bacteroidales bacterium]